MVGSVEDVETIRTIGPESKLTLARLAPRAVGRLGQAK